MCYRPRTVSGGRDIALLDTGVAGGPPHLRLNAVRAVVEPLDMYELPGAELSGYLGLIVTGGADQELLYGERRAIRSFLDAGCVVVASCHLMRPWLPGAGLFVPRAIRSHRDYAIRIVSEHPVFAGVCEEDLTLRHGVAGFFARGHNPPPAGVEVVLELPGGEPVVYVDRVSTRGTILAHSGPDLLGWGIEETYDELAPRTTAVRIVGQLLDWIRDEARALAGSAVR